MDQRSFIKKSEAFGTTTFASFSQDWQGLRPHAEIEVKTVRYSVTWFCLKYLNKDGTLNFK